MWSYMCDLMCHLLCKCLYHRCWNMSSFVQTGPAWISLSSHGAKISLKYIEKHKLLENERQTRFVLKTCYLGIFPGASTDAGSVTWTSLSCTTTSTISIISTIITISIIITMKRRWVFRNSAVIGNVDYPPPAQGGHSVGTVWASLGNWFPPDLSDRRSSNPFD